jgi:hypothetical protein
VNAAPATYPRAARRTVRPHRFLREQLAAYLADRHDPLHAAAAVSPASTDGR